MLTFKIDVDEIIVLTLTKQLCCFSFNAESSLTKQLFPMSHVLTGWFSIC